MFYIFHGPDQFSAKEALTEFKSGLGDASLLDLNTTELDGKTLTVGELTNQASTIPLLSPQRLIVVWGYLTRLGGSGNSKGDTQTLEKVGQLLDHLPPTTALIFVEAEALKKNHPILQKGTALPGCVRTFTAPAPEQLPKWIENRVREKGASIDAQATRALATVIGSDLYALDNEIEKLVLYVASRSITLADVELLCPYTADSETFAMANAIGRGDLRAAQNQMHKRLEEGQSPLAIMGSIAGQFRGLLEVKSLAAEGMTAAQIAKEKGWRSDYAAKMRLQEANRFSQAQLVQIFNILLEADMAVKTGEIEQTLALDLLLTRLCRP